MQELSSFFYHPQRSRVSCGYTHTAFLKENKLYTFGSNYYGQLGCSGGPRLCVKTPTIIPFNEAIVSVNCGSKHTAFITKGGKLYAFGYALSGRIGDGCKDVELEYDSDEEYDYIVDPTPHIVATPKLIPLAERAVAISCGDNHSAVITEGGNLYTFGDNKYNR